MLYYIPSNRNVKFFNFPLKRTQQDTPYLYVIHILPHEVRRGSCCLPKDFTYNIPDQVLNDISYNLCKIVFDYSHECYDCTHSNTIDLLNIFILNTVEKYNLTKDQVVLLVGNLKPYKNLPYTVCTLNKWQAVIPIASDEFNKTQNALIAESAIRKYKILCLMLAPRKHRVQFAYDAFVNNLKDGNLITCQIHMPNKRSNILSQFSLDFNNINFLESLPWIHDALHTSKKVHLNTPAEEKMYLDSYVNFVIETFVDHTSRLNHEFELDISEKTFKPISRMQPFVVLGQAGILAYLKSLGYKTFENWWDESYDTELDSAIRYKKVWKLFVYFNSLTKEHLAELLKEMQPILEHNRTVYENLSNSQFYMEEFNKTIHTMFDKYKQ